MTPAQMPSTNAPTMSVARKHRLPLDVFPYDVGDDRACDQTNVDDGRDPERRAETSHENDGDEDDQCEDHDTRTCGLVQVAGRDSPLGSLYSQTDQNTGPHRSSSGCSENRGADPQFRADPGVAEVRRT